MTSDAKVGLLLGLAFIFIIAFVINGLPNFKRQSDTNELTDTMARPQRQAPGIGTAARKINREVITRIEPIAQPAATTQINSQPEFQPQPRPIAQDIRFEFELPRETTAGQSQPVSTVLVARETSKSTAPIQPVSRVKTKIYTVEDGDSLASIAKRFYGDEEGNRRINIEKIFIANSKVLRKADEIYVGQKLTIPPLRQALKKVDEQLIALAPEKLEPVESVGRRHPVKQNEKAGLDKYYAVKEGDSLWTIASEKLGNGSRYLEIVKLNGKILEDEDHLVVGMRLALPAR